MVSIVIPTHNRSELLIKSVDSVLKQTYKDYEIVIVSDGSTDGTRKIIQNKYKDIGNLHFYEYFPAKGGNHARNYGINKSRGEYIAFLDDDDEWLDEKLALQMDVFEQNKRVGLVYTGVNIIYANEGITYCSLPANEGDLSKRILIGNCIGTTSTVIIKKKVLEKTGIFDETLGALQDYDLWIRAANEAEVGVITKPLVNYYNYRNAGQVSQYTDRYEEAFDIMDRKYEKPLSKLSSDEKRIRTYHKYLLLINKSLRNEDRGRAQKYIKKAMKDKITIKLVVFYILSYFDYSVLLWFRKKSVKHNT